ncbi:MAG: DegT/DnrJ/EryC1/StrS family aminotransferase [Nitrososphaerales archaeon]
MKLGTFLTPLHIQPAYAHLYEGEGYPVAEELSRKGVNLPSGNTLTKKQIEYVVNSILSVRKSMAKLGFPVIGCGLLVTENCFFRRKSCTYWQEKSEEPTSQDLFKIK